ncbi:hypothetical protein ANN_05897 [Periplaneta americana]|uniref:Uncharacterized protein n=1 Tax=Periplaneta americana TaxID=6978 RepID=A0ABQ8TDU3_PERAM|nr:hypothetical protein ANN_05897 [Periplaneta americana]
MYFTPTPSTKEVPTPHRTKTADIHEEVQGLATQGSVRRIDIIAIKNHSAYILDPTIRFETHADQPHEVDSEKKRIYEPTIPFYKDKYSLSHIDVMGLMVGARETWTLRRSEEKSLEAFEMWMERVKWTDKIRNEAVLERVDEKRVMLKLIRKRKRNWLGHCLRRNSLLKDPVEGMVNGRRVRGRRRYQMIDDIKIYGSYKETKRKAENRKDWTTLGLQ